MIPFYCYGGSSETKCLHVIFMSACVLPWSLLLQIQSDEPKYAWSLTILYVLITGKSARNSIILPVESQGDTGIELVFGSVELEP